MARERERELGVQPFSSPSSSNQSPLERYTKSITKRVKSPKIKTHFCAVFGPCAIVVGLFVTVEDS